MNKHISIIGAGIGGLSLAIALKRAKLNADVYEGAASIKPVGAGIVLANNAMQIYEQLGVRSAIQQAGCMIKSMEITNQQLKKIAVTDLAFFEKRYNVSTIAIHRADLQQILANEVGWENIKVAKRLTQVQQEEGYRLSFSDGTKTYCDMLFGADGIHSVVRNQLHLPGRIRDSGQVCWRGICEVEKDYSYDGKAIEAWGKGKRFGFVKVSDRKLYWFAVANSSIPKETILMDLFRDFHPDLLAFIENTKQEDIVFTALSDLEPSRQWHNDHVCLLGDAAHATTPNLGQGACQAIEDAFTLGKLFEKGWPASQVFKQYETIRMERAHYVVNTSRQLGKIAQWENSMAVGLRNNLLRMTPSIANIRQLERIFNIDHITKHL